jgi:hypothetical protein
MGVQTACDCGHAERRAVDKLIWRLDGLVTCGPSNLDIAYAMSAYGYDALKWAEGQIILAQLVNSDDPPEGTVAAASAWVESAASVAWEALGSKPQLLAKLGLNWAAH